MVYLPAFTISISRYPIHRSYGRRMPTMFQNFRDCLFNQFCLFQLGDFVNAKFCLFNLLLLASSGIGSIRRWTKKLKCLEVLNWYLFFCCSHIGSMEHDMICLYLPYKINQININQFRIQSDLHGHGIYLHERQYKINHPCISPMNLMVWSHHEDKFYLKFYLMLSQIYIYI